MLHVQRKFGLDGSGGYRTQMEKTMERDVARGIMAPAEYHFKKVEMMESLASGVDDGRTRTQGICASTDILQKVKRHTAGLKEIEFP